MTNNFDTIAEFIQYEDDKPVLNSEGLPILVPSCAFRTVQDLELLIEQNSPLDVIKLFATDISQAEQFRFAHEYIEYLGQLAKAERHNSELPIIGKDSYGEDILADPVTLPNAPKKPELKTVDEILAPYSRVLFKKFREKKIKNITVEVDGLLFDGDELSTERMNQRIQVMSDTETILWTLANNEVQEVTKRQLFNAFKLAVDEQSKLWN